MWNDYEEKMSDQIVRTMENYTAQFPEVKVNKDVFWNSGIPCSFL
jgi:hypothetical protein